MTKDKIGAGVAKLIKSLGKCVPILAIAALTLAGAPARAEITVLKNFTLIDGTGRAPVLNSALVMDNGRISWVGPVAQLKTPSGARIIDIAGKYVIPGLIDNHVHLGLMHDQVEDIKYYTRPNVEEDLHILAAYGVTTVQVLGTDKDLIFDLRKAQRAGRPTETRVFTAGQGIVYQGSYGGVPGLNQPVSNAAEAVKAVDTQAAKGVDLIKFWMDDEHHLIPIKMPYDVSAAIIDEAHKHHLKAVAHLYYLADAKKLVDQGLDGLAHEVRDQEVDQALLDAMKRRGTWQMTATLGREAAFVYPVLPFLEDPFLVRGVTPGTLTTLRSPAREKAVLLSPAGILGLPYHGILFPSYGGVLRNGLVNFGREAANGLKYGMGTDSDPPGRFPGFNAHVELELMVLAGLTPMQALVAATSGNAEWLGDKDIGTVAPAKWADLVVLDADPLTDIRNTRSIDSVYIAGNSVPTIWQTCRGRPLKACSDMPKKPYH